MSDEIDNRMEKIRLKNEELEKKHKEILEDKLTAEKQNATINSLNLNKEKYEHPYDKIDLDYDVKISAEEMVELSKNLNAKSINASKKPMRNINKKSLDEIPPDPINFLREDNKSEFKRNHQERFNQNPYRTEDRRKVVSSKDTRPRVGNHIQRRNNPEKNELGEQSLKQEVRRTHPQSLRNEKRIVSNFTASINSETNDLNVNQTDESNFVQHTSNQKCSIQRSNKARNDNNNIVDRKNITIQLSNEVRSVKIHAKERVGSGRVALSFDSDNTSYSSKDNQTITDAKSQVSSQNRNKNPKRHFQKTTSSQSFDFKHPILDKIVISKTSVQERLLRSRLSEDKTDSTLQGNKFEKLMEVTSTDIENNESN